MNFYHIACRLTTEKGLVHVTSMDEWFDLQDIRNATEQNILDRSSLLVEPEESFMLLCFLALCEGQDLE
jgi:hypothetical protein